MPKIQVNEKDLSWYYRQRKSGQLVVYMPGIATFGPYEPTLVDESNFTKIFGPTQVPKCTKDLSYHMAQSFIKTGISVLFHRVLIDDAKSAYSDFVSADGDDAPTIKVRAKYEGSYGNSFKVALKTYYKKVPSNVTGELDKVAYRLSVIVYSTDGTVLENFFADFDDPASQYWYENINRENFFVEVEPLPGEYTKCLGKYDMSEPVALSGGTDGVSADFEKSIVTEIISRDLSDLTDHLSYHFNIIVDGGYNDVTSTSESISEIDEKYLNLVKSRGDAIYLVDGHRSMSASTFFSYTGLPDPDDIDAGNEGFNTSYAAAFGPWCSAELPSDGSTRTVPGSFVLLTAWGKSLANGNPLWMAPAGVKRGSVGNFVKDTQYRVGSTVLDQWQDHKEIYALSMSHKVNPIMNLKQYGYVIYGNGTLLKSRTGPQSSMLQSFSVRVLSNLIKTHAFDVSLSLQFDQIDSDLFAEFRTLMTVFMDQLRYGGALYDYRIVADYSEMTLDDLNSRTVPVRIMISPNPAAENFIINLEISQAGLSFGEDSTADTSEHEKV